MRSGSHSSTRSSVRVEARQRLLRQAVDEVEVHRAEAAARAPRRSPRGSRSPLCTRLTARCTVGVEVLHADADAVEAEPREEARCCPRFTRARIDLDRVLAVAARSRNAAPDRVHQRAPSRVAQEGRRAAAPVHAARRGVEPERVGARAPISRSQVVDVLARPGVVRVDDLVARAVEAERVAERARVRIIPADARSRRCCGCASQWR